MGNGRLTRDILALIMHRRRFVILTGGALTSWAVPAAGRADEYVISQCMETILGKSIPNRFDLHFSKNISPGVAEGLWLPIVDMMLSLSNQLENAFS